MSSNTHCITVIVCVLPYKILYELFKQSSILKDFLLIINSSHFFWIILSLKSTLQAMRFYWQQFSCIPNNFTYPYKKYDFSAVIKLNFDLNFIAKLINYNENYLKIWMSLQSIISFFFLFLIYLFIERVSQILKLEHENKKIS